ncbi:hypothetical protein V2J09_011976 [Rumex salicifolius]
MDAKELKKGLKIEGEIERVNGREISYSEFVDSYLSRNRPVVVTGVMDDWRACKDWVCPDGKPNLSFFSEHFGKSQVADCGDREFTDQKRVQMTVSAFIKQWLVLSSDGNLNNSANCNDKSLLYLKDWHFVKEYPEYVAYTTPPFFADDWLNCYLDQYHMHNDPDVNREETEISCSDYRFVYMGPKGTWTPLHADVFRSYSWSANVCGAKLWLFLPPPQKHLVFDRYMKNCVYNIFEDVSEVKFPEFKKAVWLECTQGANEIIFVPSGWYHQVHNLEDTISINHNWFNAYNLSWVWDLLLMDYNEAKEYIDDIKDICDDFEVLCQRNLAANTGMNFNDFFTFLVRMSLANFVQLNLLHSVQPSKDFALSTRSWCQHIVFNLISVRRIASKMDRAFSAQNYGICLDFKGLVEDHAFQEFLKETISTHQKLHQQSSSTYHEIQSALLNRMEAIGITEAFDDHIRTPESLVRIIDSTISKFSHLNGS